MRDLTQEVLLINGPIEILRRELFRARGVHVNKPSGKNLFLISKAAHKLCQKDRKISASFVSFLSAITSKKVFDFESNVDLKI